MLGFTSKILKNLSFIIDNVITFQDHEIDTEIGEI